MSRNDSYSFKFPVKDFKRLETPLDSKGYRNYLCVVDIQDLPDFLTEWGNSNVRDPKDRGRVPNQIRAGLLEEDLFVFMNRGLVLVAERVDFDNKSSTVEILLTKRGTHGLIDGGHTHLIINNEKESLAEQTDDEGKSLKRFVKIEILVGFDISQITDIAGARNTSNQVKDESLLNLEGRFEDIKKALKDQPYYDDIAFKEYDVYEGSDIPKPIDVRDIISIMYMFNIDVFDGQKQPVAGYSSKAKCVSDFQSQIKNGSNRKSAYYKILPILPDLLRLHDEIWLKLPELYNKACESFREDVEGGKFGKLTGVTYKNKAFVDLYFLKIKSKYRVPAGFLYPILGSFRALIEEKNNQYNWIAECNPFELLKSEMGLKMADAIGNVAREDRNPSKTGKYLPLWQNCYQIAFIHKQEIELRKLRKGK